jgi:hypothetical protein
MALGPGKYDEVCTAVRKQTHAAGVVLVIISGDLGSGFSVQAPLPMTQALPDLLEQLAKDIRESGELNRVPPIPAQHKQAE